MNYFNLQLNKLCTKLTGSNFCKLPQTLPKHDRAVFSERIHLVLWSRLKVLKVLKCYGYANFQIVLTHW